MFTLKPLSAAVMASLLATPALAADGEQTLPEVRVTAAAELPATDGYQALTSRSSVKTDTPLLDTPQSVTVVTSQQIKDQAVQSMAEAVRYTPGVSFAQGEGNRDAVVIRGSQSTGDFYLDGVRDDVQYYRDLYNIDRIELLKGANGLAFGRGGAGGVVNRVSKEAGWTPVRELGVSVGSYGHKRATLDVGQGLSDSVAGRINVVTEQSDSYRQDVELRRNGISPTLTIKPGDRTKVVLSGEFFNDLRTSDRGIPSQNGKPFKTDSKTFFGNPDQSPTETTVNTVAVAVEHRLQNGVLLSNKTRFADYDKYYQNVFANSAVSNAGMVALSAYVDDTQRENVFNQTDVVFKFATGPLRHQMVTGVEVGRQDTENFRINGVVVPSPVSASNPRGNVTFAATKARDSESRIDVASAYVQDQIAFGDKWQAVLGARHDRFETDFTDRITAANSGHVVDSEVSPRAALIFKPVDNVSLYASYSQTFVPRAGDQLTSLTGSNRNFDPEEFINKEVGAKWDVRPDLSLTAAVYRLERNNVAVPDPVDPTQTILVDGQLVRGVELGVAGKLTQAWSVTGGYSHADSEIKRSQSAAIQAGNETAQTPRHTFSLWNRYDFSEKYGAALGVVSRSAMYALDNNRVTLPGYARVDAAFYMKVNKDLDLQLNLENLTNRDYYLNAHNDNNITPGSPISARLSAVWKF